MGLEDADQYAFQASRVALMNGGSSGPVLYQTHEPGSFEGSLHEGLGGEINSHKTRVSYESLEEAMRHQLTF